MILLVNQSVFERDLFTEMKSKFPDLSIEELTKCIRELANDWRYIYAHETSWGYKVRLNSIGEAEAKKLFEKRKKPKIPPKTRNERKMKLVLTLLYIVGCVFLDVLLFPIITFYVIGLIAVEVTILFGIPKLLEWFSQS